MDNIIKKAATATLKGNNLSCPGTNINQVGDILSDAMLLIPWKVEHGFVSLGVLWQAEAVYKRFSDRLHNLPEINLSGHSLGAGVALLVGYKLLVNGYPGIININCCGGVKGVSKKLGIWLSCRAHINWRIRRRDPVPYLGWWSMPALIIVEGDPKKHIFDYDIKEHVMY